jgi:hypothetical protein
VGYWYQFSVPRLPSGRIDKCTFPGLNTVLHVDGESPNLLTDVRDIGAFVARIVGDERTLNRYVYTWGDVLTEKDIYTIMEEVSGEELERKYVRLEILALLGTRSAINVDVQVSAQEIERQTAENRKLLAAEPENMQYLNAVFISEYEISKYVRMDNRPEYAKYLGYLDARELYPEFEPKTLREFVGEMLEGKVKRPYYRVMPPQ